MIFRLLAPEDSFVNDREVFSFGIGFFQFSSFWKEPDSCTMHANAEKAGDPPCWRLPSVAHHCLFAQPPEHDVDSTRKATKQSYFERNTKSGMGLNGD